ncbi:hypothetical protein ACMU_10605 [Actibacterium mucosum KCTC 23349]|uniref:Probable branched-chain-amino-acid aminotransferase n=1 Tax=Actibacterium mucosum KCTC 23349 TaxID=1454373 RepID=A0A037ZKM6_9RHOB|nr:aminotransferase class IV [Actibacterium mucosum]KAJ56194.1 hypothetical protein ACMU_10605 [Actibacterium mucosum KCTC 23349]
MENTVRPDIPAGLEIFETMRADQGGVALLSLHLDRMCETCRVLDVPFDRAVLTRAVLGAAGGTASRLRLTLQTDGRHRVDRFNLPPAPEGWRLGLAEARVDAGEFWRGHKTSHRAIYDTAREEMPEGIDELLFLNTAGHCVEGTITNLFVDPCDGLLRTPPLSAGALPGILRRKLIEARDARVAPLRLVDLTSARRVYVGNALRGLIPVSLDIPAPA